MKNFGDRFGITRALSLTGSALPGFRHINGVTFAVVLATLLVSTHRSLLARRVPAPAPQAAIMPIVNHTGPFPNIGLPQSMSEITTRDQILPVKSTPPSFGIGDTWFLSKCIPERDVSRIEADRCRCRAKSDRMSTWNSSIKF